MTGQMKMVILRMESKKGLRFTKFVDTEAGL